MIATGALKRHAVLIQDGLVLTRVPALKKTVLRGLLRTLVSLFQFHMATQRKCPLSVVGRALDFVVRSTRIYPGK